MRRATARPKSRSTYVLGQHLDSALRISNQQRIVDRIGWTDSALKDLNSIVPSSFIFASCWITTISKYH